MELTEVIIPNSVEEIGGNAFYANKLTRVIIPDSVRLVEETMFGFKENEHSDSSLIPAVFKNGTKIWQEQGGFLGETIGYYIEDSTTDDSLENTKKFLKYAGLTLIYPDFKELVTSSLPSVEVSYATSLEDAKKKLPLTLQIKDDIGGETTVDLTWTIENYNPTNPGVYAAKGVFTLPYRITNLNNLPLEVEISVKVGQENAGGSSSSSSSSSSGGGGYSGGGGWKLPYERFLPTGRQLPKLLGWKM